MPPATSQAKRQSTPRSRLGRLFVLDLSGARVFSVNIDGSDPRTLVTGCRMPDGIAIDSSAGHMYWTNMGVPSRNDGSIERADLDGGNRTTIVPQGGTFTPKQLVLEKKAGKLYWCDREGMRVMRCNLDGSRVETLVQTGHTESDRRDQVRWCVGIALDPERAHIYWTQKGTDNGNVGRIFRAGLEVPRGQSPASRKDIEVVYDGLPEPIDLELDLRTRTLYWTDRGDPPRGNTVNRAPLDAPAGKRPVPEVVFKHLMEGIGIALDAGGNHMYMTDLGGSVYSASLDGSEPRVLQYAQGNLSGIAFLPD
jgi:DNA-binding beta-propeller fold protein YncE